jgi:hypothetical protein
MNDKPLARINQWSKTFPNARLAVLGLILIVLAVGVGSVIEATGRPLFEYLTQRPGGEIYWELIVKSMPIVGILLLIPTLAGMTMIPFAAYRAIRDRFATR